MVYGVAFAVAWLFVACIFVNCWVFGFALDFWCFKVGLMLLFVIVLLNMFAFRWVDIYLCVLCLFAWVIDDLLVVVVEYLLCLFPCCMPRVLLFVVRLFGCLFEVWCFLVCFVCLIACDVHCNSVVLNCLLLLAVVWVWLLMFVALLVYYTLIGLLLDCMVVCVHVWVWFVCWI